MMPLDARIDKLTRFFVKRNAFLAAQKILAVEEQVELPEALLTEAWAALYDLAGYAKPADGWNPGTWTRLQAVERR